MHYSWFNFVFFLSSRGKNIPKANRIESNQTTLFIIYRLYDCVTIDLLVFIFNFSFLGQSVEHTNKITHTHARTHSSFSCGCRNLLSSKNTHTHGHIPYVHTTSQSEQIKRTHMDYISLLYFLHFLIFLRVCVFSSPSFCWNKMKRKTKFKRPKKASDAYYHLECHYKRIFHKNQTIYRIGG